MTSPIATAKERLSGYLRDHRIWFTVRHHPPAFAAQEVAAREHVSGDQLAKPVVVVADGLLLMLVLPASYLVHMSRLSVALGTTDLRLADEAELARLFPDCELGALPPFGNLYGLDVCVDRTIAEQEHIEFRAGTHTETFGIAYADFARLVHPTIIDVARHH